MYVSPSARPRVRGNPWSRVLSPAPRDVWRELLTTDPNATFFHSPEWIDQVCSVGGGRDASRLYETRSGGRLLLPLVRRSHLGGLVSVQGALPAGWGIGGLLSDGPLSSPEVTAVVQELRDAPRVLRTVITPGPRSTDAWDVGHLSGVKVVPRRGHLLELDRDFDRIWSERFTGKTRTAVRKAEKSGVLVEHDTTGALIPEFLHLRRKSVERWARQQNEPLPLARWRAQRSEPDSRLQAMADAASSGFHLYLARHENRAVAGIVVLYGRGASHVLGAMDKALAAPVRANDLLQRVAIEDACRAGLQFFDCGETGTNAELAAFKMRFGAEPTSWSDYVIERLPITEAGHAVRTVVKRAIGFQGPPPAAESTSASAGSPAETSRV